MFYYDGLNIDKIWFENFLHLLSAQPRAYFSFICSEFYKNGIRFEQCVKYHKVILLLLAIVENLK